MYKPISKTIIRMKQLFQRLQIFQIPIFIFLSNDSSYKIFSGNFAYFQLILDAGTLKSLFDEGHEKLLQFFLKYQFARVKFMIVNFNFIENLLFLVTFLSL